MADDKWQESDIGPINEALRDAWPTHPDRPAFEARHRLEYGDQPISPSDLNTASTDKRTIEEYRSELDRQFAAWEAEQKAKGQEPAAGETDTQAVDAKVDAILTERWGASRAEKSEQAGEMLREIFPTPEAMVEFGRKHGIDRNPEVQANILDLLAEIRRARR